MKMEITPSGTVMLFDEELHRYFDQYGRRYDSVTGILEAEGYIDTEWFTEEAALRGTEVHKAVKKLSRREAEIKDFRKNYWFDYLEAYIWFCVDTGFQPHWIEKIVCDERFQIAGTLDMTGTLRGRKVLIDLKTGDFEDWHPVQLAAYAVMGRIEDYRRYTLHLKSDGKYTLKDSHRRLGSYQEAKWAAQWALIAGHWRAA